MNQETLKELFIEQIRDIFDAEKQLVKALPKLAKAAESEELAEALRSHLVETQTHVSRLEEIFGIVGVAPKGKTCKGMKGLIEEGSETVQEEEEGVLRDLAIIAAAQRVEHYEMSAYGTARTIAEQLDLNDAVELLQQTEDEEKEADSKLTQVAMTLYQSEEEQEEEMVGATRRSYGTTTADGLLALAAMGTRPEDDRVQTAQRWLAAHDSADGAPGFIGPAHQRWTAGLRFYYAGAAAEARGRCSPAMAANLKATQRRDGSWRNPENLVKEDDPLIATPFAVMALQSAAPARP